MAVLPIVHAKEGRNAAMLRTPAGLVTDFGVHLAKIVEDLIDTLMHHKIAVGLAAPQIGISMKVAVININKDKLEPTIVLVNPRVTRFSGNKDKKKESCMSLPHFRGEVIRRDKIEITYQDCLGVEHSLSAEGFLARVISHELDHLDGVLYIDRMEKGSELEPVDFFRKDA